MHWTAHIMIGASLGYATGKPLFAELAGIVEHFTLDMLPHRDTESDPGHLLDTALGVSVLLILARSRIVGSIDPGRSMLYGAIGGALPDCELLVKAVKKDLEPERLFFPTHNGVLPHGHTESELFSYSLETLITLISTGLAIRRYKKLKQLPGT